MSHLEALFALVLTTSFIIIVRLVLRPFTIIGYVQTDLPTKEPEVGKDTAPDLITNLRFVNKTALPLRMVSGRDIEKDHHQTDLVVYLPGSRIVSKPEVTSSVLGLPVEVKSWGSVAASSASGSYVNLGRPPLNCGHSFDLKIPVQNPNWLTLKNFRETLGTGERVKVEVEGYITSVYAIKRHGPNTLTQLYRAFMVFLLVIVAGATLQAATGLLTLSAVTAVLAFFSFIAVIFEDDWHRLRLYKHIDEDLRPGLSKRLLGTYKPKPKAE